VGGLAELVPHQKVGYVTSQEPRAIADCLIDFYENNREDTFVKNIKTERLQFTWDRMIKTIFSSID